MVENGTETRYGWDIERISEDILSMLIFSEPIS